MRYSRPTERRVLRGLRVLRVQPAPRVLPVRKAPPAQPERKVLRALPAPRAPPVRRVLMPVLRSEEHTSELQSLMRNSYAVFCLKKKKHHTPIQDNNLSHIHQI